MSIPNWSLKVKLLGLCFFLSLVSVVIGTVSIIGLSHTSESYQKVTNKVLPELEASNAMFLAYRQARIELRTLGLPGLSERQAAEAVQGVKNSIAAYDEANADYLKSPFLPAEKELHAKVDAAWKDFREVGLKALAYHQSTDPDAKAKLLELFLGECPSKDKPFRLALEALTDFHKKNGRTWSKEAIANSETTNLTVLLVLIIGTIIGLSSGTWLALTLSNKINQLAMGLSDGAVQVTQASEQIANSAQSLAKATTQQASSLEETVATMEELTAMVKLNSENAGEAARLSLSTRSLAITGEDELKALIASISQISTDSKKIADITSVIDDIAFQTNLLALNASVEAARAGEQGKGFAVVAEAVRSLAHRSAESAKSIALLIAESVDRIKIGTDQANKSGVVLSEIVSSVKKVSDLNSEISTASAEQSNGISQIGKAMNLLDQVTQDNALVSDESASSAEELSSQATHLQSYVSQLKSIVTGVVESPVLQDKPEVTQKGALRAIPSRASQNVIPFDKPLELSRKLGSTSGF